MQRYPEITLTGFKQPLLRDPPQLGRSRASTATTTATFGVKGCAPSMCTRKCRCPAAFGDYLRRSRPSWRRPGRRCGTRPATIPQRAPAIRPITAHSIASGLGATPEVFLRLRRQLGIRSEGPARRQARRSRTIYVPIRRTRRSGPTSSRPRTTTWRRRHRDAERRHLRARRNTLIGRLRRREGQRDVPGALPSEAEPDLQHHGRRRSTSTHAYAMPTIPPTAPTALPAGSVRNLQPSAIGGRHQPQSVPGIHDDEVRLRLQHDVPGDSSTRTSP
ncbi:MAG: hypothetical protein MZV70_34520 [Desulfobacterales bacterium]|nr:hypothetical protein [Desulfobacterales bacterium]